MLFQLFLLAYAGAVGFVAAGIVASAYQLMTREPPRFRLFGEGAMALLATFVFVLLTGPIIMARTAMEARQQRSHPPSLLFAGIAIVGAWSCCSGILMLGIGLGLRQSMG